MTIREQISQLSAAEKILLAEDIWDSIEANNKSFLSEEKKKFLDERMIAIQKGEATFVTLDEIKKKIQLAEMKFRYQIDEVAAAQLLDAVIWYEEKREGLGNDLVLCFEDGIETICSSPLLEERYKNLRLFNIHRFPYQIIYFIEEDLITIVAFFHAHRDPKNWKK